jgi:hypothetical protein
MVASQVGTTMHTPRFIPNVAWLALLAAAASAPAQEPPAVRRIVLPTFDSQVAARLIALERRLNPVKEPEATAALAPMSSFAARPAIRPSTCSATWHSSRDASTRPGTGGGC